MQTTSAWRASTSGGQEAAALDKQAHACAGEAFVREGSLSRASSATTFGILVPAFPEVRASAGGRRAPRQQ